MKATDLIIDQHRIVSSLFEQFEAADPPDKLAIFEEIAQTLVGHDAIEREIFYPACEKALGRGDFSVGEALVAHGVVEFCVFRADQHRASMYFDAYVKVVKDMVEHHVREEETELLPRIVDSLSPELDDELGEMMEARFDDVVEEDFRLPLRENLEQVLAGRTKTKKSDGAARQHRAEHR